MLRTVRPVLVMCLVICFVAVPCRQAAAADDTIASPNELLLRRSILTATDESAHRQRWGTVLAPGMNADDAPPRVFGQVVASTSHHNFILGATAAGLIIGGVALIAYSTTPSCKQGQVSSGRCDRDKVLGAVGVSGGAVTLILWALSK